ncbi:aminoglycoside phosphotransferase family protein [Planosporangium sp. 12N6]|uniref:aminoglycoside phosphotransferase family protein n=1 Tax=Planosporangium spinosum TaxID=3402278 RepID=UPI003CE7EBBE
MHADQVDITAEAVAALVAEQFPHWADRPVRALTSHGTVNALFRLGTDVVLRFPLLPSADAAMRESLAHEQDTARLIARHTRSLVPEPLALGRPAEAYPGWWTAYAWIPGETAGPGAAGDPVVLARDLARFVGELRAMDTGGRAWDGRGRGGPLAGMADAVDAALAQSAGLVDVARVARAWQRCLMADRHTGPEVWIHADLMPGNLLLRDGRLVAVIDLGSAGIGDPAVDLMPAWNLLDDAGRRTYRAALDVDDATWERGRGWAIAQAIMALPYYRHTNPVMADTARRTLAAAVA